MIYSYNTIKDELKDFSAEVEGKKSAVISGKFTSERVHPMSLPEGVFMYECRHADNVMFGLPRTVEPNVIVNFAGTLFTDTELSFDDEENKYISLKNVKIRNRRIL